MRGGWKSLCCPDGEYDYGVILVWVFCAFIICSVIGSVVYLITPEETMKRWKEERSINSIKEKAARKAEQVYYQRQRNEIKELAAQIEMQMIKK